MRTMLLDANTGEQPENEICVVIDSGEPSPTPHVLTRCHPDEMWDLGESENVPCKADQNIIFLQLADRLLKKRTAEYFDGDMAFNRPPQRLNQSLRRSRETAYVIR
jgi:hypothetical protein